MPARLPTKELKWTNKFEDYLREEKKIQDEDAIKYYRNLFQKHLEGREINEKLIRKLRNVPLGLYVVFRNYVRYLLYKRMNEDTFAWPLVSS